jgi:serine/threonine protein kinase
MHEKGFAHNDIKPENILVEKISEMEKNFVLADFGCAMK